MQPFHTIDVSEMCREVVLSQGVILTALCATDGPIDQWPGVGSGDNDDESDNSFVLFCKKKDSLLESLGNYSSERKTTLL